MYRCPCCGLYMKYYTDYDCAGNIVGFWHCQLCHYDTRNIQNTVTSTNDFNQIIASKVNSAERIRYWGINMAELNRSCNTCKHNPVLPKYEAKVITRGNCMMCGKELTEGLFFCKECETIIEEDKKSEKLSFGDYDDVGVLNQFDNMTGSMNL